MMRSNVRLQQGTTLLCTISNIPSRLESFVNWSYNISRMQSQFTFFLLRKARKERAGLYDAIKKVLKSHGAALLRTISNIPCINSNH